MDELRGTGRIVAAAALLAMMAVLAGAFGAHWLEGSDARAVRLLETGSRYQLGHAAAVLALRAVLPKARLAMAVLLVGALVFPSSLYALALGAPGVVAGLAPLGGLAFVIGWGLVVSAALSGPRPLPGSGPAPPSRSPGHAPDRR